MLDELTWGYAVQEIPAVGLAVERSAAREELEAIARSLELPGCRSLVVRYVLTPGGGGHVHLAGTLEAQVEQTCVVTLEPLLNDVSASFKVDYWPETELPESGGGVVDIDDETELEPIAAGRIDVGRVVFQALAGSIDLFPRKPGVTFEPPPDAPDGSPENPFSALAKMKDKS